MSVRERCVSTKGQHERHLHEVATTHHHHTFLNSSSNEPGVFSINEAALSTLRNMVDVVGAARAGGCVWHKGGCNKWVGESLKLGCLVGGCFTCAQTMPTEHDSTSKTCIACGSGEVKRFGSTLCRRVLDWIDCTDFSLESLFRRGRFGRLTSTCILQYSCQMIPTDTYITTLTARRTSHHVTIHCTHEVGKHMQWRSTRQVILPPEGVAEQLELEVVELEEKVEREC